MAIYSWNCKHEYIQPKNVHYRPQHMHIAYAPFFSWNYVREFSVSFKKKIHGLQYHSICSNGTYKSWRFCLGEYDFLLFYCGSYNMEYVEISSGLLHKLCTANLGIEYNIISSISNLTFWIHIRNCHWPYSDWTFTQKILNWLPYFPEMVREWVGNGS